MSMLFNLPLSKAAVEDRLYVAAPKNELVLKFI